MTCPNGTKHKFKAGDVVVCTRAEFQNETVGMTYVVREGCYCSNDKKSISHPWFEIENDDNGGPNSYHEYAFELAYDATPLDEVKRQVFEAYGFKDEADLAAFLES